jgi:CDP-diacylglycerol--glycerol-3-phosphate 3-phosphatidyltransferase
MDALHAALCRHPLLRVYLVLDLNRSTRPGPTSTAHILVPLLKDHPGRVHISLFRSPKLSGLMAKLVPPRYNEGWGTWHAKIYGADDDIMISGSVHPSKPSLELDSFCVGFSANLNQSYFTNRQDRYIVLRSQPSLARYCMRFLETVSTFSFQMLSCSHSSQGYELRWPDPNTHPHRIQAKAEEALVALQSAPQLPIPSREGEKEDALIVPIIQAGQFNVREEEQHMAQLFHCLAKQQTSLGSRPLLNLTSGYFGLYKPYQDLILQSHVDCQIVAASPKVCLRCLLESYYTAHAHRVAGQRILWF